MRVAIMGNSGSGKSTLARELSHNGQIPILDLDTVAWLPNCEPTRRPLVDAHLDLERFFASSPDWIVEGCYGQLIEIACSHGAELIFLNPGTEHCVQNCLARPWESHKYPSKEAQDKNLDFLLQWVRDYEIRDDDCSLACHVRIFNAYSGPKREVNCHP